MKAISKMYRISSFNADDARIYPEIAIKPPFFRFPNKSKLTSDVTQGLYFIGYERIAEMSCWNTRLHLKGWACRAHS